jgi:hypothetical protein
LKDKKAYASSHLGPHSQDIEATYGAGKFVHVYRLPPEQETKKREYFELMSTNRNENEQQTESLLYL